MNQDTLRSSDVNSKGGFKQNNRENMPFDLKMSSCVTRVCHRCVNIKRRLNRESIGQTRVDIFRSV